MNYDRDFRGIKYRLEFNGFWRCYSEIGDFFGRSVQRVMQDFRDSVKAGPEN